MTETKTSDDYRKSTPSLPPRPVELSLIADYPNPWAKQAREELRALSSKRWFPHSSTFRSVAAVPNEVVREASGRLTTPDLIPIVGVSDIEDVAKAIACLPGGKPRPPRSVKRVNLFGHGRAGLIGLRGRIEPKENAVYFGDRGPDRRPDVLMDEVDLCSSWAIDELTLSWLNSCSIGLRLRDGVRRVFSSTPKAELWLVVCHGAGGVSGLDVGSGSNLSKALASTFQVTVRAYSKSVWYWPERDNRRGIIRGQNRTSEGIDGDRRRGYYCAEPIIDPEYKEHVGEHMKKADTFEPDPKREPFKVSCP